jgi:hypothetical protein
LNSRLHFKITTSSFQTKLCCLCTRARRGFRLHRPFRATTGALFSAKPPTPPPPTARPRFTQQSAYSTKTPSPAPPPPDPHQNPIRRRRAQPDRVPTLRRQPYLHCRSQQAAARTSPSSFAHQPPSTISILYPSPLLPSLHKNLSVTALHQGEAYFLVIPLPIWFCMFPNWL